MNKVAILFVAMSGVVAIALAASPGTYSAIPFRFLPASEAYKAVDERFGRNAVQAVSSVDHQNNALILDGNHPDAERVREFLRTFDRRPEQVMVRSVIKRKYSATADSPAREEWLGSPTHFARPNQPIALGVKTEDGEISIELRVEVIPGDDRQ